MKMNLTAPPPEQMMGLITGYWRSQAVGVAAKLAIADRLGDGPKTVATLAAETATNEAALFRLLRGLASFGVFEETAPRTFELTPLGETLRSNVPGSMRDFAMAETAPGHWLPWGNLDEAVRTGARTTPAALGCEIFEWYGKHPVEGAAFSGAMGNLSALAAQEAGRVLSLPEKATVVDVGGAHGTLLAGVLNANPAARGILTDLPHVIADAPRALAAMGIAGRAEAVAGDFFQAVPEGDVYLLKQVLHDWSDEQCVAILRNCARAMKPGGKVVVVEMVVPEDGTPSLAQIMDLNMLVMLPGRERTEAEFNALFQAAGLSAARVTPTHSPFSLVEAGR
ncbi:MAG: methyltransferase [Deltaproteobacteria bacterium]